MKSIKLKKYEVWKTYSNCEPIIGSERILTGPSKRWIIRQIAYENGIEHKHNDMIVKLSDGCMFFCIEI